MMAEYSEQLYNALTGCLQAIETGVWTVEECLARYPDYQEALEPLLRTALRLRAASTATPSPTFRQQAPARLRTRLAHSARPPVAERVAAQRAPARFTWRFGTAAIMLALLVVVGAVTATAVAASDSARPGDLLYGLDRAVENIRLRLASNEEAEGKLLLKFADERLGEAAEADDDGDEGELKIALRSFDEVLAGLQALLASGTLTDEEAAAIEAAIAELLAAQVEAGLAEPALEVDIEIEDGLPEVEIDVEGEADDSGGSDGDESDNSGSDSDDSDDEHDNSDSDSDDSDDEHDNSGSGSGDSEDDEHDNSGSGSGDSEDDEHDNSDSGSDDSEDDEHDNSGSDSGDSEDDEHDNSDSDSSDDEEDEDDK